MNLVIHSSIEPTHFCDLTPSPEKAERVQKFLMHFQENVWKKLESIEFDRSKIICNLHIAFLFQLIQEPTSALCTKEMAILKKTKGYEKQTRFFLNTPGMSLLLLAALLSAVAGGVGYYYGVKGADLDVTTMSWVIGLGTLIGAVASNMLGFYITGTLPNNASEAENAEQNMWDDFAQLKTKPSAYQLLEWYSPSKLSNESEELFQVRRKLALYFVDHLDVQKIIACYKLISTQSEKIDIVLRYLDEACDIIKAQKKFEESLAISYLNPGELRLSARLLNYFTNV